MGHKAGRSQSPARGCSERKEYHGNRAFKVSQSLSVFGFDDITCLVSCYRLLWSANPIDPEAEKYYSFTRFACELNEPEDGVAPTDSRLRPDQRLMENAQWDEANREKVVVASVKSRLNSF